MQRTTGTHWVFRLIPPRPTFDEDMTDEVRALVDGDPAVASGIARMEWGPMRVSIVRTP